MKKPLIGFIGQGWIGKNYSHNFEQRGYTVVRYSLDKSHKANRDRIKECDVVFIAVPTPSTPKGFDDSHVMSVLPLVGKGKIAVIKSTLTMGLTKIIQAKYRHCLVLHSPEFLSEKTAAYDAAHPTRNIIGIPNRTKKYFDVAKIVMKTLPKAPYNLICSSDEAEFIKYSHNINGYVSVVFTNILYDLAIKMNMDWKLLSKAFGADPFMSHQYLNPIHKSGRGAGGHCFIKDFEAFIGIFKKASSDRAGLKMLESIRDKNVELLISTKKDLDILEGVYGRIDLTI